MNRYDITTVSQFRDSMSEKYFRHVVLVISYIHIYIDASLCVEISTETIISK